MNELHLFAGCGGGILGGILLGHTCVCAVEIEPYRRKVLLQRQRDEILPRFPIWDDVRTFDGKPWQELVDVVCGGFPCTDISSAGTGEGINGKQSGLWKEMARIIRDVRPPFVFVENSPVLTSRGLGTVLGDLAEMGFNAKWGVLSAADAIWLDGTPCLDHLRERIWIAASNSDEIRRSVWRLGGQGIRRPNPSRNEADSGTEKTSDANGSRRARKGSAQPTGRVSNPFAAWPMQATPNSDEQQQDWWEKRIGRRKRSTVNDDRNGSKGTHWWKSEPGVDRVVYGLAYRLERCSAIGDGQVPAVVKLAWETLIQ